MFLCHLDLLKEEPLQQPYRGHFFSFNLLDCALNCAHPLVNFPDYHVLVFEELILQSCG